MKRIKLPTQGEKNPISMLSESGMSIHELRVINEFIYSSMSSDREAVIRHVEKVAGIQDATEKDISKLLSNLTSPVLFDAFTFVPLFECVSAKCDLHGSWNVVLSATQTAIQRMFSGKTLEYLKRNLNNVISLKSKYSYILYLWIEKNMGAKPLVISVEELRELLGCDKKSYETFKILRNAILNKAKKEIGEKTPFQISYETIKDGLKVVAVQFNVESEEQVPTYEVQEEQSSDFLDWCPSDDLHYLYNMDKYLEDVYSNDFVKWLSGACTYQYGECEFTRDQMERIAQLVQDVPVLKMPKDTSTWTNDYKFRAYHLLESCYRLMNKRGNKIVIRDRYAYLCKLLEVQAEDEG